MSRNAAPAPLRFTGLVRDAEQVDKLAGRRGAGAKMLGLAVEEGTDLLLQSDRLEVVVGSNIPA